MNFWDPWGWEDREIKDEAEQRAAAAAAADKTAKATPEATSSMCADLKTLAEAVDAVGSQLGFNPCPLTDGRDAFRYPTGGSWLGDVIREYTPVLGILGSIADSGTGPVKWFASPFMGTGNAGLKAKAGAEKMIGLGASSLAHILKRDATNGARGIEGAFGAPVAAIEDWEPGAIAQSLIIHYGNFGGGRWGTTQHRGLEFLACGTDIASFNHDNDLKELNFIRDAWRDDRIFEYPGPIELTYKVIATVGFSLVALATWEGPTEPTGTQEQTAAYLQRLRNVR